LSLGSGGSRTLRLSVREFMLIGVHVLGNALLVHRPFLSQHEAQRAPAGAGANSLVAVIEAPWALRSLAATVQAFPLFEFREAVFVAKSREDMAMPAAPGVRGTADACDQLNNRDVSKDGDDAAITHESRATTLPVALVRVAANVTSHARKAEGSDAAAATIRATRVGAPHPRRWPHRLGVVLHLPLLNSGDIFAVLCRH